VSAVSEQLDTATGEVLPRRVWVGEMDEPSAVLDKLPDDGNPQRRRRLIAVRSAREALRVLEAAPGHRVPWLRGGV